LLVGPGTERLTFLLAAPIASWALIVSLKEHCHPLLASLAWLTLIPLGTGGVERLLLPIAAWSPAILPAGIIPLMAWQIVYFESRAKQSLENQEIVSSNLQNQNPSCAA
jgi:arginine exporter protein ArgO